MLILISPAKTLDYETAPITDEFTLPDFIPQSAELIQVLRQYSVTDIAKLMKLSDKLAELNVKRYKDWTETFTSQNAKQALLAFKGDVYTGLNAETFSEANLAFAQDHLRMLSGLYGLLRPLDLMQPYRLEMGTRLENKAGANLYDFWGSTITDAINQHLENHNDNVVINLASNEYFKAVKPKHLNAQLITPQFKELKDGQYKMIGIFAKRARGLMSRYIIENELSDANDLKAFNWEGYQFNSEQSSEKEWVFTRSSAK